MKYVYIFYISLPQNINQSFLSDFAFMEKLQFICYKDSWYRISSKGKFEIVLLDAVYFNRNKNGLWDVQCQELNLFKNVISV